MQQYFQGHTYYDKEFSEATGAARCSSTDILSCTGSNMDFACSTILSGCTCCDVHITMATDALRRSSFYVDVHTTSHWSSTCPLQQHTESSRAQVICQSRRQLIEMIPVTVEQITRTTAICKRKKYLGFNIQSSKQAPWQVQEPFSY